MKYRHLRVAHLVCGACLFLISTASVGGSTLDDGIKAYESEDYQTAIEKWQTLIQQGSPEGLFYLGVMYAGGKGLAQDKTKAFQLYSEAAQKDHLPAQYNLGMQYATGEGVTQDFSKAEYWWTKAAERGLMQAQFNLGNLYYYGLTGEKNPVTARKWLTLAAKQGSPHAKESLARLERKRHRRPAYLLSLSGLTPHLERQRIRFGVRPGFLPSRRAITPSKSYRLALNPQFANTSRSMVCRPMRPISKPHPRRLRCSKLSTAAIRAVTLPIKR